MLHSKHPLFQNSLWRSAGLMEQLEEFVHAGYANEGTLQATGIPGHVALMKELHEMPEKLMRKFEELLDNKGITSQSITRDALKSCMQEVITEVRGNHIFSCCHQSASSTINVLTEESSSCAASVVPFLWNGAFHRVPEDFTFPKADVWTAWQLWFQGDARKGIPPFRFFQGVDLPTRKEKKTLSDWNLLMKTMKEYTEKSEQFWPHWIPCNGSPPTSRNLKKMYKIATECLPRGGVDKRKRRTGQLKLSTVVRQLRQNKKQRTQ